MTTRARTLGDDLKAWAHDQLGVRPDFCADEVLRAYLRQVEHDNGNPNLTAREAMLLLTRQMKTARPTRALEAAEDALQREVDDFAQRFFDLPVAQRRAQWDDLRGRGQGFARIEARLGTLRAGIDVTLPYAKDDPTLGELVATVGKLFVLRPAPRAAERQAWLHEARQNAQWDSSVAAAQRLRQRHPEVAALEPALLARLADGAAHARERAQLQRQMRKAARTATAAPTQKGGSWNWAWVAVVGGMMLLRFISWGPSGARHDPPPGPWVPPAMPDWQKNMDKNRELHDILKKVMEQHRKIKPHVPDKDKADARFGPDAGGAIEPLLRDQPGDFRGPPRPLVKDRLKPP